jgi:hypothetical protein
MSASTDCDTAGRIDKTGWDGVENTDPAIDAVTLHRRAFDHEAGAPLEAVPPEGSVS